jgi:hypothetical protein
LVASREEDNKTIGRRLAVLVPILEQRWSRSAFGFTHDLDRMPCAQFCISLQALLAARRECGVGAGRYRSAGWHCTAAPSSWLVESPANGVIILLTLNCDDAGGDAKQNSKTAAGSEEERLQMRFLRI